MQNYDQSTASQTVQDSWLRTNSPITPLVSRNKWKKYSSYFTACTLYHALSSFLHALATSSGDRTLHFSRRQSADTAWLRFLCSSVTMMGFSTLSKDAYCSTVFTFLPNFHKDTMKNNSIKCTEAITYFIFNYKSCLLSWNLLDKWELSN